MSTQFISILPPPGPAVLIPASASHPHPEIFTEALSVRTTVFVNEQKCSLENEIDADDPRSWHWVVYASVSTKVPSIAADGTERRTSEGGKVVVGTIRLVPPPHQPHPAPGSVDGVGGEKVSTPGYGRERATKLHDGKEPYVKLGRMATLKEYRGLGLAKLLVSTAIEWAGKNAGKLQPMKGGGVERERAEAELGLWKGLVLVHAQKDVESFYKGLKFVKDEELGEWTEEGIVHIGMWRRIEVGNLKQGEVAF